MEIPLAIKEQIFAAKHIVITSHYNPDGDAIGSTTALCLFLQKMGLSAHVISPNAVPSYLQFLPGSNDILNFENQGLECQHLIAQADLVFALDFNDWKRTEKASELFNACKAFKIMIDHHLEPSGFDDYRYWVPGFSSTCELIYNFIVGLGGEQQIDAGIATSIYTGIMTDTGSFKFSSTTANTHTCIAFLLNAGADRKAIYHNIDDGFTWKRLKFLGYVIAEKLSFYPDYKTAVISVTKAEIDQYGLDMGDTEGIVNYGLSLMDARMAVLMIERHDLVKMSFRSKGDIPANLLAKLHFNGGGHLNAAGGKSFETLEATEAKLLKQLDPFYNTYKQLFA